jgi:hypothetical protein
MTAPNRTEELIVEMLERRASTAPPWLTEETTKSVRRVAQRRGGRTGLRTRGRVAAVAGVVAAVALLAGGLAIGSGLLEATAATSPAPTTDVGLLSLSTPSEEPTVPESAGPAEPTASLSGALAGDSIAVVTTAGDGLRVRSLPGTGSDSKLLTPLLERRTRMLVLDGPVQADGYDWYQIYAEQEDLAGWVARGDDGVGWIRPGRARCPETLDESSLYEAASIDLLVCFQGRDTEIGVRGLGMYDDASCDLGNDGSGECAWSPSWFERQGVLSLGEIPSEGYDMGGVATRDIVFAPSVPAEDIADAARGATITLSFDHPDAQDCRAKKDGRDAMPPWRAVLACRLMPVVEEVRPDPEGP